MSSSTLFRIAGGILLIMPIGHVRMAYDTINPGLQSLGDSNGAFSSKTAWASLNGYFIATGKLWCIQDVNFQRLEELMLGSRPHVP